MEKLQLFKNLPHIVFQKLIFCDYLNFKVNRTNLNYFHPNEIKFLIVMDSRSRALCFASNGEKKLIRSSKKNTLKKEKRCK